MYFRRDEKGDYAIGISFLIRFNIASGNSPFASGTKCSIAYGSDILSSLKNRRFLAHSFVIAREKALRYRALSQGLYGSIQITMGSMLSVEFSYTMIFEYSLSSGIPGLLVLILLPVLILLVPSKDRLSSGVSG
jgi:hypothetical protein